MGRFGIGFNDKGRWTAFPSVVTNINPDNLDLRNQGPTGVVALLAAGAGFFQPKKATALRFDVGSPQRFISASDLLTVANFAVTPFNELDRAVGQIFVVPVNASTPSTKALNKSVSTLVVTLTSKGWGLKMNQITVKHEVISSVPRLTVKIPTATSTIVEVFDYTAGQLTALVAAINERSALVSAVLVPGENASTLLDFAEVAMTGGTEPAAITQDWDDALHALDGIKVNCIHVATATTAIWTMLNAYCIAKRSRGFVGGSTKVWAAVSDRAASIASLKAEAAVLNAPRIMHVGLGMDGQPAYLAAARYAALAGTLEPSVPMTFKHLDVGSLEARLDVSTEIGGVDGVLLAGLAVPCPDPDSPDTFIVSRGLSTWTGDDNLYRREHSVLAAVDGVQDLTEAGLRPFLGGEGTLGTIQRTVAKVDAIWFQCTKAQSAVRIFSYRRESLSASFSSDTVLRLSGALTPIAPINFIDMGIELERTDVTVDFDANLAATN